MRKTKIICTLGPVSNDVETIKKLIKAGLCAARINFSHGSYESHSVTIENVKKAREELNVPIPLILDTKGPEIRLKTFEGTGEVTLEAGNEFILTTDDVIGTNKKVSVSYKNLNSDVKVGGRILLDDGLIELIVNEIKGNDIICSVVNGGIIKNNKGVNVPDASISLPALTEKDEADIKFGIEKGFDYIAASFIRSASDILKIREVLKKYNGEYIKIIAKIESREGVNNVDEILSVTDGIMVARGDLGVEIEPEEVPIVQKNLIKKCNKAGKLVVTATQMLESMIVNPRPTRAEVSDVANAVIDGSDAIMLSGETASGAYPCQAVEIMSRVAEKVESTINYDEKRYKYCSEDVVNVTDAISHAACDVASEVGAAAIVTVTNSGFTSRNVSKFKPSVPIVAVTCDEIVRRQLNLTWGCIPILSESITDDRYVFPNAVKGVEDTNLVKKGDTIVAVAGVPLGKTGTTNTIKVEVIGEEL